MMKKALRGINLGGWLVAERWMTPKLYDGVEGQGEIELVRQLGKVEAIRRLSHHRETFITEADFSWIAKQGFDIIRLPVGYWIFQEIEDFVSGEKYVEKAFRWAKKYNLRLILDLHGLPGSQNGKEHSGIIGRVQFFNPKNIQTALETVHYIAMNYGNHPQLAAIQVINEPRWGFLGLWLWIYYYKAIKIVVGTVGSDVKIIISDGFQTWRATFSSRFLPHRDRLVLDVHLYQAFSLRDRKKNAEDYKTTVQKKWRRRITRTNRTIPVLVGEWSTTVRTLPRNKQFRSEYFLVQKHMFDETAWAHCYWSYKAPGLGTWDYKTVSAGYKKT